MILIIYRAALNLSTLDDHSFGFFKNSFTADPDMKNILLMVFFFSIYTSAEVTVVDYLNRRVILEKPAERIVALAPHIVENLYSAGAGEKIVGAVEYSDFPESAKNISRVGAISAFSLEAIVNLRPDLVVVWRSGKGGRVLEKLDKMGIVAYASDPRRLNDVPRSIRDYGTLTGSTVVAEKAALKFEKRYQALSNEYRRKKPVSTLYQVWNDPIQTLNDEHIISDVLRLCGATNVFGGAVSLAPKISIESVIHRNPLAIIASGMGEQRPDWLDDWKKWKSIRAVRNKNLYFVHPDLIQRHTVRILEGARQICQYIDNARRKNPDKHVSL